MRTANSVWVLVGANLVPLGGVLFADWKVEHVLVLYWMENFVVGAYSLLRIAFAQPAAWSGYDTAQRRLTKLAHGAFFALHFGAINVAFGVFVVTIVQRDPSAGFGGLGQMVNEALASGETLLCLAVLAVSHGWSFLENYIGRSECKGITTRELRNRPYRRVVPMYFMVVFVGVSLQALGAPLFAAVAFVALKMGFDVYFHTRDHSKTASDA